MTRRHLIFAGTIVTVVVMVMAIRLRTAWDAEYAIHCAQHVNRQLDWLSCRSAPARCPAMDELTLRGAVIASSPRRVIVVSHGLVCSIERSRPRIPCAILIRIGRPALLTQKVVLSANGPVRLEESRTTSGAMRTLRQAGAQK